MLVNGSKSCQNNRNIENIKMVWEQKEMKKYMFRRKGKIEQLRYVGIIAIRP